MFPRLNAPDTKFKAEGEYSTKLRLPADDAGPLIAQLTDKLEAFYKEECAKAKKPKLKRCPDLPWKDVEDEDGNPTGDVDFKFALKARVTPREGAPFDQKPAIFDAATKPMSRDIAIWGGSKIRVSFEVNAWNTALGVGMSLRLKAVQVLELVSGSGGSAESYGFGAEDGYTGDDEDAAPIAAGEDAGQAQDF